MKRNQSLNDSLLQCYLRPSNIVCNCCGMCCDDINLCISFISCILAEPTPLLSDAKIHTLKTIQRMNNLLLYSAKDQDLYRPYH